MHYRHNLIMDTDSYKFSHYLQYPPDTTHLYAYLESKGGYFTNVQFFGLNYIIQQYLSQCVEMWMVEEAQEFAAKHGVPFNYDGWKKVVQDFEGHIPLMVEAVPEGGVYPVGTPLMAVYNTEAGFHWLVTWFETQLMRVWYPTSVATISFHTKLMMMKHLSQTADKPTEHIQFMLHDFGSRGVSSSESAGIGGMAHLVNFMGTDTIEACRYAKQYYNEPMAGFSIPATEHSTMTCWGQNREKECFDHMIDTFLPEKPLSIVTDSYDHLNAVQVLCSDHFKSKIIEYTEKNGTKLVVRPDSGDLVDMVLKTLRHLNAAFGHTINQKGYKILNHVRVFQGDGVDYQLINHILEQVVNNGWCASNLVFGMGGGLLQKVNRDSQKFAMKVSCARIQDKWVNVFKNPVTDPGKKSKSGFVCPITDEYGNVSTGTRDNLEDENDNDLFEVVYDHGMFNPILFGNVRIQAKKALEKRVKVFESMPVVLS